MLANQHQSVTQDLLCILLLLRPNVMTWSYVFLLDSSLCINMMSAPASARAVAIAAPIPLVPPVTTAVLPSSENIFGYDSAIVNIDLFLWLAVSAQLAHLYIVYKQFSSCVFVVLLHSGSHIGYPLSRRLSPGPPRGIPSNSGEETEMRGGCVPVSGNHGSGSCSP